MAAHVVSVHRSATHSMAKESLPEIRLLAGIGVEGDVHAGATVMHLSRLGHETDPPNLRQVHLMPGELHAELQGSGFSVTAGQMGENITTRGIDLLGLPVGARLHLGNEAVIEVTGLRTPCAQLERIQTGLMSALLDRDADGRLVRKAGIMSIVVAGGPVRPGDPVMIELPPAPHRPLEPV